MLKCYLVLIVCVALVGCAANNKPLNLEPYQREVILQPYPSVERALSDIQGRSEFSQKIQAWHRQAILKKQQVANSDVLGNDVEEIVVTSIAASTSNAEGVTNNQESNVDEGGIVKKVDRFLVVLRQGRLYVIDLTDKPTKVSELNVQGETWQHESWYDEILVHNNTIVVIGYSYEHDSAEYLFFNLTEHGHLQREKAFLIKSGDYFSGHNYASRLVDGNLIFFLRDTALTGNYVVGASNPLSPITATIDAKGNMTESYPLFSSHTVYRPLLYSRFLRMSTLLVCPLDRALFSCDARSVLGGYSSEFYMSANAAYLWVSGDGWDFDYTKLSDRQLQPSITHGHTLSAGLKEQSVLYRFALANEEVGAVRVQGEPLDQFSFSEHDEALYVVSRLRGYSGRQAAQLNKVPINLFNDQVSSLNPDAVMELPIPHPRTEQINRFIDDTLVYAHSDWRSEDSQLFVVDLDAAMHVVSIPMDYYVEQIYPIGDNGLVIGDHDIGVAMSTIALNNGSSVVDTFTLPESGLSESRSHSFLYKQYSESGFFAFPVEFGGEEERYINGQYYYSEPTANMLYMQVNKNLNMMTAGSLEGDSTLIWSDDDCDTSCYDWYGSSRPLFIGDRVFALLKYELIEGQIVNGQVYEKHRIDLSDKTK